VRTTAIWVFGLVAAAIIGGFIGSAYDTTFNPYGGGAGGFFGAIGAICIFACARLWLSPKKTQE